MRFAILKLITVILSPKLPQPLMIINLMFHLIPSEDQSSGSPGEVRRELSPKRVQPEGQRADTAPGPKWE